jgi:hypothetical protein
MTTEQIVESQIKGLVNALTPEAKDKILACVVEIRAVIAKHGDIDGVKVGDVSIAIIGSELAARS